MNITEYQTKLKELESMELAHLDNVTKTLANFLVENNLPIDCKPFLKDVKQLSRFDFYYCTYEKHGEKTTYRRMYNNMKQYDYPMSNVSYNNGVFPQVPHVKFNGVEHQLPNSVIQTLESVWNTD